MFWKKKYKQFGASSVTITFIGLDVTPIIIFEKLDFLHVFIKKNIAWEGVVYQIIEGFNY